MYLRMFVFRLTGTIPRLPPAVNTQKQARRISADLLLSFSYHSENEPYSNLVPQFAQTVTFGMLS